MCPIFVKRNTRIEKWTAELRVTITCKNNVHRAIKGNKRQNEKVRKPERKETEKIRKKRRTKN
jgi:hypothetical protein